MPFLMDVDAAAERVVSGLKSKRFEVTFPKRFTWGLKLARCLPYPLYFALTRRMVAEPGGTRTQAEGLTNAFLPLHGLPNAGAGRLCPAKEKRHAAELKAPLPHLGAVDQDSVRLQEHPVVEADPAGAFADVEVEFIAPSSARCRRRCRWPRRRHRRPTAVGVLVRRTIRQTRRSISPSE